MIRIDFLDKAQKEIVLPQLFALLHENMKTIAPSGKSYEEDYDDWKSAVGPGLDKAPRQILLLRDEEKLIGFFQYYVSATTFVMEEIQFDSAYQETGLFHELYAFLAKIIPEHVVHVEAFTDPQNVRSQAILQHLGLEQINPDGPFLCFHGDCQKMLARYRSV